MIGHLSIGIGHIHAVRQIIATVVPILSGGSGIICSGLGKHPGLTVSLIFNGIDQVFISGNVDCAGVGLVTLNGRYCRRKHGYDHNYREQRSQPFSGFHEIPPSAFFEEEVQHNSSSNFSRSGSYEKIKKPHTY